MRGKTERTYILNTMIHKDMTEYDMFIEIPIGTEVIINGTRCVAVKDRPYRDKIINCCKKCILVDHATCDGVACCSDKRWDRNNIHFEKVL